MVWEEQEKIALTITSSINYALRVLKPVLDGDAAHIDLKLEAEDEYIFKVQDALRNRVWHAGCNSVRKPCYPLYYIPESNDLTWD